MSSRPSTSTSEHESPASALGLQRSFTLPTRLARPPKPQEVEIGAAEGIETLFAVPAARVVSFSTASSLRSRPSSRSSVASYDAEREDYGSAPWTAPTERTMAAGPLEIYRVPGSVAFLHSGSLLHAILPRSQCWCVDGVSKFAMRVLPNTYYRIELPANNQEDLDQVEQLKTTLGKVLYYERTSCPFQRGFESHLPEMPSSNTRRMSRASLEPAKRWKLNRVWRPEGAQDDSPQLLRPDRAYYNSDTDRSDNDRSEIEESGKSETEEDGKAETEEARNEQSARPESRGKTYNLTGPFPSKKLPAVRSITAPPQLSLESSPPSKVRKMAGLFNQAARETALTPPRPALATLVPKLPPTPESLLSDREPIIESPDKYAFEFDITPQNVPDAVSEEVLGSNHENESTPADTNEPLIIIEQPEGETELITPVSTMLEVQKVVDLSAESRGRSLEVSQEVPQEALQEVLQEQAVAGAEKKGQDSVAPTITAEEQLSAPLVSTATDEDLAAAPLAAEPIPTPRASPALSAVSSNSGSWSSALPIMTPAEATDLLRQRRSPSPSPSTTTTPASSSASSSTSPPSSAIHTSHRRQPSTQLITTNNVTPALIVRKTCALFLGPPAHLVATMLRIAARLVSSGALNLAEPAFHELFAGGAAAATAAGRLRGHRRVPGSWDLSDDDEDWGF